MENHRHKPEIYLEINLRCCDDCPKELKKALLKIQGVYTVVVDQKREMVMVVADIDPQILVQTIKKMGKTAQVIIPNVTKMNACQGKNLETPDHRCSHGSKEKSVNEDADTDTDDDDSADMHEINDCQRIKRGRGKHHRPGTKKKEEYQHVCQSADMIPPKIDFMQGKKNDDKHKCESYEKGGINPKVCSDFYCKLHALRGIIHSKVPSIDSEDHPCHTSKGVFNDGMLGGNSWCDQSVPTEYFPQRMPPLSDGYGSYPTSIMPENHEYGNYSRRDMHMPMSMPTGYNDEHMAYSRRPMPMTMPAGYNDEQMAYLGSAGYHNDEHMAYSGRAMPLHTGYNHGEHMAYSERAMPFQGGYNDDEHMAYSGWTMPISGYGGYYQS